MTVTEGSATIEIDRLYERWVAHDLVSGGNPQDLIGLLRKVQQMATIEPIWLTIDEDNPDKDRLLKLYERMGAKPVITWLVVN